MIYLLIIIAPGFSPIFGVYLYPFASLALILEEWKKKEDEERKGEDEKNSRGRGKNVFFFRIGEATGFGPPLIRQHANDSMKYKTRTIGF